MTRTCKSQEINCFPFNNGVFFNPAEIIDPLYFHHVHVNTISITLVSHLPLSQELSQKLPDAITRAFSFAKSVGNS